MTREFDSTDQNIVRETDRLVSGNVLVSPTDTPSNNHGLYQRHNERHHAVKRLPSPQGVSHRPNEKGYQYYAENARNLSVKRQERYLSREHVRPIVKPLLHAREVPYVEGLDDVPDYSVLSVDEYGSFRNEFWIKISEILTKHSEWSLIKPPNEDASVEVLHRFYHSLIKKEKVESSVDQWKTMFIIMMQFFEGCVNYFSPFNIEGFSSYQIDKILSHDQLIIEIGEKYISTGKGSASPEEKLAKAIIFNGIIFISCALVSKLLGMDNKTVQNWINTNLGTEINIDPKDTKIDKKKFGPQEESKDNKPNVLGSIIQQATGGTFAEAVQNMGSLLLTKTNEPKRQAVFK